MAVLIIFPLILQTVIDLRMLSIGGCGVSAAAKKNVNSVGYWYRQLGWMTEWFYPAGQSSL